MNTLHDSDENLHAHGAHFANVALVLGIAGAALALFLGHARDDHFARLQHAWLVASAFFLTITLGSLFFVIIQHLTRAGWSVVVRRVAEFVASNVIVVAFLFLPIVVQVVRGDASLYPWADPAAAQHDPHLAHKAVVLNGGFFAIRCGFYFLTWILLSRWLLSRSLEQDGRSDPAPTLALERRAAPAMIAFAITACLAAFDILMTLSPMWYSTIFGVYVFAGSAMSFFATVIIILRVLQRAGFMRRAVTVEHFHDLGKFLFAFVFFWGYIAFSQFLLIWYADIPEETFWFRDRLTGTWTYVSYALLVGHFIVPFAGLLSRHAKRNLSVLTFWAVWLLAMHALDVFWIVMPKIEPDGMLVSGIDAAAFVSVTGIWTFALVRRAARHPLVPTSDPRLPESLAFENS